MARVIILIAGLPGAGKSVFSDIAKSMNIPVVVLGDIVRDEVRRRGLEITLENVLAVAQELREKLGKEALAVLAIDKIKHHLRHSCVVVVDGVRSPEEVQYIKRYVDAEVLTIAIHASPKTRFARLRSRGRTGDPRHWEEFTKRDVQELSWGIGNVIALADIIIVNEGSIEEFKKNVEELISKVIAEWCT